MFLLTRSSSNTNSRCRIETNIQVYRQSQTQTKTQRHQPAPHPPTPRMKLLFIISCLLLAVTGASKSWFRENYLQYTYDEYYEHTMTLYRFGDNERDMCPDVHKSATFFAITGRRPMNQKMICLSPLYAKKLLPSKDIGYQPPEAYYVILIRTTVNDIIEPLGELIYDAFHVGIIVISIILASMSSLFLIILVFCQY